MKTFLYLAIAVGAALAQRPASVYSRPAPVQRAPHYTAGHAWFYWPAPAFGGTAAIQAPPAEQKGEQKKEAPAWVTNKDYVPERLNPVLREYPEGTLPRPAAVRSAPPPGRGPCTLLFHDGQRLDVSVYTIVDDTLLYTTSRGARGRVSLDLVKQDEPAPSCR